MQSSNYFISVISNDRHAPTILSLHTNAFPIHKEITPLITNLSLFNEQCSFLLGNICKAAIVVLFTTIHFTTIPTKDNFYVVH